MAKTHRGSPVKRDSHWRGRCPICDRTGVKLLWNATKDEESYKVCKHCRDD